MSGSCRKTMEREAVAERGAATERGAVVTETGWSAERVFRRSHDLESGRFLFSIVFRVSYFYVWHVGCIVRLVFVAVHYPRACNKPVG